MNHDLKKEAWERSYSQGDNYLFYPHEEVIRFIARNVRKRVGYAQFEDRQEFTRNPKVLDLGCGIGRHVRFCDDLKLEAYGIDLSEVAIGEALRVCDLEARAHLSKRFHVGSITDMPYEDDDIDFIVSHGVLDSLPFSIAKQAMSECSRVIHPKGKFYLDLISGDDSSHSPEFSEEEIVTSMHEKDTIQSYFNFERIEELIADTFVLDECRLIRNGSGLSNSWHSRYHVVLVPKT